MDFRILTLLLLLACFLPVLAGEAKVDKASFLTQLKEGRRVRIVTYGTSLTASCGWPEWFERQLRHEFGCRACVINAAKGGMNSRWGLANVERRVIRRKPDAVFLEFAINDALAELKLSVEESVWDLEQMILRIRDARPRCEIFLLVANPPTGPALAKRPEIAAYEEAYRETARRHGCRLIDLSPRWRRMITYDPDAWIRYAPDGLHPTQKASREVTVPWILESLGIVDNPPVTRR